MFTRATLDCCDAHLGIGFCSHPTSIDSIHHCNLMQEDFTLETGDIRISGLGKCYRIYDKPQDRLREALSFRGRKRHREFWALRGIDLQINKGETWGIIGRNGSGKSTLLQMLCGTVSPTEGTIEHQGRIAALLELGNGFNPEFTGEENIALNAALLGLNDRQIAERHDAIVAFADIGDFINQQVKKYSSGMYVRLAFAIASHADPDILVVDEALSVGDIAFQNKCVTRIKELRERGLTLIFVSHDLGRLQLLCDKAAWIHQGQLKTIGEPIQVCQDYYAFTTGLQTSTTTEQKLSFVAQQDTGMARFLEICLDPSTAAAASGVAKMGEALGFRFVLEALQPLDDIVFAISIYASDGTWLVGQTSLEDSVCWPGIQAGQTCVGKVELKPLYLSPGEYRMCVGAYTPDLSVMYALSDLHLCFSVRSDHPAWGLFHQPCHWIPS